MWVGTSQRARPPFARPCFGPQYGGTHIAPRLGVSTCARRPRRLEEGSTVCAVCTQRAPFSMTISVARAPSLPNNPAAIVCRDPKTRHTTQHLNNVRAGMIKTPVELHGGRSCFERQICTPASAVTSLIPASTALPHTRHSQGSKACLMGKNPNDKQAPVPLGPLHPDRGS